MAANMPEKSQAHSRCAGLIAWLKSLVFHLHLGCLCRLSFDVQMHASMAEAGKTLESPKFSPEDKPDTHYEMANSDLCVHINKIPL